MENKFCSYELCKLLADNGYAKGSNYCIQQFDNDYVYDDDPKHPESHKKGEIRYYNLYYNNKECSQHLYEMPTYYDIIDYLKHNKNILLYPIPKNKNKWNLQVIKFDNISNIHKYYEINANSFEEAIEKAIKNYYNKTI